MYKVTILGTTDHEKYRKFEDVEDYYYNDSTDVIILYHSDGVTRAMLKATSTEYYLAITKQ